MADALAGGPTIVSAFDDDVDLIVAAGSGFGGDEPFVGRVEVEAEGVSYAPGID